MKHAMQGSAQHLITRTITTTTTYDDDDDVDDEDDDDGDGSLTFQDAFAGTKCASTSCGVVQSSNCPPAPTPRPTPARACPGSDTVDAATRLSGVSAALLVLALAA